MKRTTRQLSRNKCEGINLFIYFRKTQEFNLKVMLNVPSFVFHFLGKKILEFCEEAKSTHLYSMTKYCQRLLNVFANETV